MGKFMPSVVEAIEFDGDTITVEIEPMSQADFMRVAPYMRKGDDDKMLFQVDDKEEFDRLSAGLLQRGIKSINGLTDATGRVLGLDDVLRHLYFIGLRNRLVSLIFSASTVGAVEEKKSGGQSAPALTESIPETIPSAD